MMDQGWISEVEALPEVWRNFVADKGIIGYPEIIENIQVRLPKDQLIKKIQQQTWEIDAPPKNILARA